MPSNMTPYERLLAEQIPTGTFGNSAPPRTGPRPWTALEQAHHLTTLLEALDGWEYDRDTRRHLRLIHSQKTQTNTRAA